MASKKSRPQVAGVKKKSERGDWGPILARFADAKTFIEYGANRTIYWQGDPADAVFFIREGSVKLAVTSSRGKDAIVAFLQSGEFFGEACLAGQRLRMATATALSDCSLARIELPAMARMLHERRDAAQLFLAHVLARNVHYEADLVDKLFNSTEKRLARILLMLARFGESKKGSTEAVLPKISHDDLAQMVGTTRPRVSHFMNKFRKLGFVEYTRTRGMTVNSSLLGVVLHD